MDRLFQLNLTNVLNVVTKLNNSPAYYALQCKYHLEGYDLYIQVSSRELQLIRIGLNSILIVF